MTASVEDKLVDSETSSTYYVCLQPLQWRMDIITQAMVTKIEIRKSEYLHDYICTNFVASCFNLASKKRLWRSLENNQSNKDNNAHTREVTRNGADIREVTRNSQTQEK